MNVKAKIEEKRSRSVKPNFRPEISNKFSEKFCGRKKGVLRGRGGIRAMEIISI